MSAQVVNFRPNGDQEWAQWAECAKPGSAPMFPADSDHAAIEAAKENCRTCPVLIECLEDSLARGEQWGVWGGLTTEERTTIRRSVARQSRRTGEPRATAAELADAIAQSVLAPLDESVQLDESAGQLVSAGAL